MNPASDRAVDASGVPKELLVSMPTPSANSNDPGSSETFKQQAQTLRRGDAMAAALIAYGSCQKLSPDAVEVLPFLNSFASVLWHTFDRRITILVDVERGCPAVFVDAAALEEALMQIAVNARSTMPHGGKLILRGALDSQDNGFVRLDVTDNGTGMSPAVVREAARPFFTTKEASPLSGMGLSVVAGFAAQSGGQMSIRSAIGRGTTIRMFLPTVASARR